MTCRECGNVSRDTMTEEKVMEIVRRSINNHAISHEFFGGLDGGDRVFARCMTIGLIAAVVFATAALIKTFIIEFHEAGVM